MGDEEFTTTLYEERTLTDVELVDPGPRFSTSFAVMWIRGTDQRTNRQKIGQSEFLCVWHWRLLERRSKNIWRCAFRACGYKRGLVHVDLVTLGHQEGLEHGT
jgi:hypothetical protein